MPKSAVSANNTLDWQLGGATPTRPTSRFLSLHTADPGATGASEASGTGYARQAITFSAAAASQAKNSNAISLTPTAALGTLTHLAIWDALSGGNMLYSGPLSSSVAHSANLTLTVAINAITVTEA